MTGLRQRFSISRVILSTVLAVILLIVMLMWVLNSETPKESSLTEADFAITEDSTIEQGRYLALAGNCASCHSVEDGEYMAGGLAFNTPFGTIYSTNITPDPDTGIGNWTGEEFFQSMRYGMRPDGQHLYPVFPYTAFTKITDDDIVALWSYLKSIPAVSQITPENDISFPFNQRSLMAFWKLLFFEERQYEATPSESEEWNRGAYLVDALAHCSACHSPRNFLGAEDVDLAMSGGEYIDKVPGGAQLPWSAPNLTSAPNGLGMWPHEEIVAYLKAGINSYVESYGPMNEVILNSTSHLDEQDVSAMAVYLKNLPAVKDTGNRIAENHVVGMGKTIYNLHCGTCHLPTGLGDEESAPRLAGGSLVVQASNPASLINVILYGPELPDPPLPTKRFKPMEAFQYELTDDEVAAVASYLRASWGNQGGVVTAEQVARQRVQDQ